MNRTILTLSALLLAPLFGTHGAELSLTSPLDYQVVQRNSPGKGLLRITGDLSEEVTGADVTIEAKVVGEKSESGWLRAGGSISGKKLSGAVEAPS
ncbi:MAG: hypothetical protein WCK17_18510, partial [Verrucomicrobiota bacterium]